ncbi:MULTISPECIES: bifunctional diguanylate cyclase/phosphodiesterase [unclassified Neorhizobium]|uniref:putative bifunctional diguanylate cyclase/phosphodiesterase n=1 Tax=unclassified Neorhizobium TaxID=2629175 RepID=UPI001FF59D89|nr:MULTISPECIES: EAL domain-containing protein [unclassified Neorhizobium]MCJ9672056.1 EAL domain-containing protein [Neorhizobium sp. SHOUNA12B]MCJ9746337.1 EAL domain-containing protein [Neorhizobium sp. SHOUNA12A]
MLSLLRALENMQQGVVLLDADLQVLVCNARAADLLQAPKGAIEVGISAVKIAAEIPALSQPPSPDDDEDTWLTHLLTRSSSFYQEISIGDRTISVASIPLDEGGWLMSCDDISVLTSLKKDLAAQNSRFESALANMPHGLCMFDAEKRLLLCNAAYARLYDLPETLTRPGTPLSQILHYRRTAGNEPVQQEAYFDVVVEAALKGSAASQNILLSDGRVIKITHNPMEHGGYVATHEDCTDSVRAEEQIKHMAGHDPLTGLPNRILLREKIDRALAHSGKTSALLCLDLDHFKEVNDTMGHSVGDLLLRSATDRLTNCLGEGDTIARLGGDEFVVFQDNNQSRESASELAQRLVDAAGDPFHIEGQPIHIGVSIGIAVAPDDGDTADSLLRNADTALYKAKSNGRGNYCFFEPAMDVGIQKRRKLEVDFRQAIANNQFEIYYQPQVNAKTEEIIGFEALVRWHHPERGLVSPAEFIPLAEETGLIVPLGEWVLRHACKDAASWPAHVRVAVNLSPVQFRNHSLVHTVISALADSGLSAGQLELEITESVLLTDSEAALATLHHIKGLGVRIAMDDFGTGYSSLSYLRLFPFDKIKIDQSFIRELGNSKDCAAIVKAVVDLGSSLGITTSAEGVETGDQRDRVREHGCTEIQGYLFGKPLPLSHVEALLRRSSATIEVNQS